MNKLVYSCVSDVGRLRADNQDNFITERTYMRTGEACPFPVLGAIVLKDSVPLAVFDGMGGEERGEMASLITAETAFETDFSGEPASTLSDFVKNANRRVCLFASENRVRSMGTTVAMLLFQKDAVYMLNVGDSPVFKLGKEGLVKISVDDVSVPIAGHKPPLTQNIGIPEDEMTIAPHIIRYSLKRGDRFLISSDGLTDMVSEERIAEILRNTPIEEAASRLTEEALQNGGRDNVTVIAAEIRNARLSLRGWK